MRRTISSISALGAISLATVAQAGMVTFNFSGNPSTNALNPAGTSIGYNSYTGGTNNGVTFDGSDGTGAGTISATVYGVIGGSDLGAVSNPGGPGIFTGGNALFAVQ